MLQCVNISFNNKHTVQFCYYLVDVSLFKSKTLEKAFDRVIACFNTDNMLKRLKTLIGTEFNYCKCNRPFIFTLFYEYKKVAVLPRNNFSIYKCPPGVDILT